MEMSFQLMLKDAECVIAAASPSISNVIVPLQTLSVLTPPIQLCWF